MDGRGDFCVNNDEFVVDGDVIVMIRLTQPKKNPRLTGGTENWIKFPWELYV